MKKSLSFYKYISLLFYALAVVVCSSCASANDKKKAEILAKIELKNKIADSLLKEFSPVIQGVWDNENHTNKIIAKTLKPSDSIERYIVGMNIDTDELIGDQLQIGVGYSDVTGENITLYFRPGNHPHSLATDTKYELTYHKETNYTNLYLYYKEGDTTKNIKFNQLLTKVPKFQ